MEIKHTKTPWAIRDTEIIGRYLSNVSICDCIGNSKNEEIDKSNAAHIVKCVNAHDELVSALQQIAWSPIPFNKREEDSWLSTARNLAIETLASIGIEVSPNYV